MLYCPALHVSLHIVCTHHRSHPPSGVCVLVYISVDRVRNLEEEFYCHATATDLQREMGLTPKLSTLLYNYWKLKRIVSPPTILSFIGILRCFTLIPLSQSNQNRPLVAAMSVDSLRLELLQQSHVGHMTVTCMSHDNQRAYTQCIASLLCRILLRRRLISITLSTCVMTWRKCAIWCT